MLEHLRKVFTAKANNPVAEATNNATQVANNNKEPVEMTTTTEQTSAMDSNAELAAQFASQTSVLETLQSQFTELSTKYAEMQAVLSQVESAKEELVAKAAEAKLAHRKESLELAVGSVKASALLATLEVLDDAAFDSVVSAMTVNLDAEASSTAFKETGVVAEADKAEVDPVKALADGFAAKFKSNKGN